MATPVYSTTVQIHQFFGIDQSGDGYSTNIQYAREMENVNVSGGGFRPMREGVRMEQTLTNPIGTLAYLHRRFGADQGTLLAAISDGKLYTIPLDPAETDAWEQRYPETGGTPFALNDFDWVTYEISLYPDYSADRTYRKGERIRKPGIVYKCKFNMTEPDDEWVEENWEEVPGAVADMYPEFEPTKIYSEDDMVCHPPTKNYRAKQDIDEAEEWTEAHWEVLGNDPVDILLISNATDGMYCLYGDTLDVVPVATPKKFGVLARYNERIWGSGIETDPDMLVYSVPYDPFNWEQNNEIPEDGAGDIQVPTWDGDGFQALRQFGNDLLAVKRNSIWRITGTDPGTFAMQQQYGGGTVVENTFAVYNQYAYMLGEYGIMRYDGSGAFPFLQDNIRQLMRERAGKAVSAPDYNEDKTYVLGEVCIHDGKPYRCTVPINHAEEWTPGHWTEITGNPRNNACAGMWDGTYCLALPLDGSDRCNAVLQYDTITRSISLRTGLTVDSFLQINERLFYTSADYPGTVIEMNDDKGDVKFTKWISGWQDLNQKHSIKSAFLVYLMVETGAQIELVLGIRTEKKLKQKFVKIKPGKLTRVHLNCQGRMFRFEIASYTAAPFVIGGGVKIDLELDPD